MVKPRSVQSQEADQGNLQHLLQLKIMVTIQELPQKVQSGHQDYQEVVRTGLLWNIESNSDSARLSKFLDKEHRNSLFLKKLKCSCIKFSIETL